MGKTMKSVTKGKNEAKPNAPKKEMLMPEVKGPLYSYQGNWVALTMYSMMPSIMDTI